MANQTFYLSQKVDLSPNTIPLMNSKLLIELYWIFIVRGYWMNLNEVFDINIQTEDIQNKVLSMLVNFYL